MEYIKEISIEKKSLIGFFKYTNKDRKDAITKPEDEYKEEKLHKIFNYELDFLKFAEDMDKKIRKNLDNAEISSIYLNINGMIKYINKYREYSENKNENMEEYYQDLELYLKELKKIYIEIYGENSVDYDIFGNSQNFKTTRYLRERAFREEDRELYKEMKFRKNMNLEDFKLIIIENLDKINYNRDEVEKLLAVPIEFFMETEAIKGEVEICNKAKFDIKKYNFPKRYENDWRIPNRYVYIYMFEEEPIWGMTAEIICDFIKILKKEGKVGFYEYK